MSRISVHIAESVLEQAADLASRDGISVDELVSTAVAEKVATLKTVDYLKERAKRGSRDKLLAVLAKAPDVEPEERDRL
jgi:hypothetical protein